MANPHSYVRPSVRRSGSTVVPIRQAPRSQPAPPAPAAKRPKPAPHEFPEYAGAPQYGRSTETIIDPAELHLHLDVAPFVRLMKFNNEKHLMNYRALLYKINVEGRFRYATRREGWSSLIVLRLK